MGAPGLRKNPDPRRDAQSASSSAPASISSPTFSMLKTCCAALLAISQSRMQGRSRGRNAGFSLDEHIGVENVGHQITPSYAQAHEGLKLRETEQAEGITMQGLTFECAGHQGAGKPFADPCGLGVVEVSTFAFRDHVHLFALGYRFARAGLR